VNVLYHLNASFAGSMSQPLLNGAAADLDVTAGAFISPFSISNNPAAYILM
jgi:hypothetical protein